MPCSSLRLGLRLGQRLFLALIVFTALLDGSADRTVLGLALVDRLALSPCTDYTLNGLVFGSSFSIRNLAKERARVCPFSDTRKFDLWTQIDC